MFNGSPLQALHDELTYFSEVETIREDAHAMTILLESVRAVQVVQIRAESAKDFPVSQHSSRIIQRLRDELYYRSEIVNQVAIREGIKTLFGEQVLNELMTLHFRMIQEERENLVFDALDANARELKGREGWVGTAQHIKALTDEQTFLLTIRNSPDLLEAIDMCRRAIHDLRRVMDEANADQDAWLFNECQLTTSKVKGDLHILCTLYNKVSINNLLSNVLGHDKRMEVVEWMHLNTDAYELQDLHKASRTRPSKNMNLAKCQ